MEGARRRHNKGESEEGWVEVVKGEAGARTSEPATSLVSSGETVEDSPDTQNTAFGAYVGKSNTSWTQFCSRVKQLFVPFYTANGRSRAASLWTGLTFVLLCAESYVLVVFSNYQRDFTNAMSEKDEPGFWVAIHGFAMTLVAALVVFSLSKFSEAELRRELRGFLTTKVLDLYLVNEANPLAFYTVSEKKTSIDNPGQRIVDDARCCADDTLALAATLFEKTVGISSFVFILYNISPYLVLFVFAYAGLGSLASTKLFASLVARLQAQRIKAEASLRHFLIYIHQYREEIAFYRGGRRERGACEAKFAYVQQTTQQLNEVEAKVEVFKRLFAYVTVLLPYVVLAGAFFRGEGGLTFGQVSQTGVAFYHIRSGLGVLVSNLHLFTAAATHVDRLGTLVDALQERSEGQITLSETDTEGISFESVTLRVPASVGETEGRVLCRDLSFVLTRGMRVLITGPNGCGKTSIFRAIGGLFKQGKGVVSVPSRRLFVLPQRLYSPQGGLRTQLRYPGNDAFSGDSDDDQDDADLVNLLHKVGLEGLPARVGGWSSGDSSDVSAEGGKDFLHILSPGEQQRIGFVRLLRAHPRVALLDEATSAMDEPTEAQLFQLLASTVPTFVTVAHRSSLLAYHTHVLSPHPSDPTHWQMRTTEAYMKSVRE